MTTLPRAIPARAAAMLLGTVLAVSGCNLAVTEDKGPSLGSVDLPEGAPMTLAETAMWKAAISKRDSAEIPPVVTPLGVLAVAPAEASDPMRTYRLTMFASDSGEPRWRTDAIPSAAPPQVYYTTDHGDPWVVMVTTTANANDIVLVTFDPEGVGDNMVPTRAATVPGVRKEKPEVTVSDAGIMVSMAARPGAVFQYHPSGATTVYGTGPTRGGKPGTPRMVRDGAWLVEFGSGGFGLASSSGGWDSSQVAPDQVNTASGRILATRDNLLLAKWDAGASEPPVLAVHSIRSGTVLASQRVDVEHPIGGFAGFPLISDVNGDWAVWGDYAFDLDAGSGRTLNIKGAHPVSIYNEFLYATDAEEPLSGPGSTSPSPASPSVSPPPTDSASSAVQFKGYVGIDLRTGTPLSGDMGVVPIGFSSLGQAILADPDTLYSVALR